jgi:hypothetical protein
VRKFILFFMLLAGVLFIVASQSKGFRSYKSFPLKKLYSEKSEYEKKISGLEEKARTDTTGQAVREISDIRSEMALMNREMKLKKYHADSVAGLAVVFAILGLALGFLKKKLSVKDKTIDTVLEDLDISEISPRELYVDDWEFRQKSEGGFRTKREAIEWIKADPALKCDYCGSRLRSTVTGDKEAVQLVTFYKKVPEGAKDLRVVLGSYWFTKSATELKCPSCERVVKR